MVDVNSQIKELLKGSNCKALEILLEHHPEIDRIELYVHHSYSPQANANVYYSNNNLDLSQALSTLALALTANTTIHHLTIHELHLGFNQLDVFSKFIQNTTSITSLDISHSVFSTNDSAQKVISLLKGLENNKSIRKLKMVDCCFAPNCYRYIILNNTTLRNLNFSDNRPLQQGNSHQFVYENSNNSAHRATLLQVITANQTLVKLKFTIPASSNNEVFEPIRKAVKKLNKMGKFKKPEEESKQSEFKSYFFKEKIASLNALNRPEDVITTCDEFVATCGVEFIQFATTEKINALKKLEKYDELVCTYDLLLQSCSPKDIVFFAKQKILALRQLGDNEGVINTCDNLFKLLSHKQI